MKTLGDKPYSPINQTIGMMTGHELDGELSTFVRLAQSYKFQGDELAFAARFCLGQEAGKYAIHGGGWPLRVRGVEGVVAVVVVSGLKQEQDHGIILQAAGEMLEELGVETGEKKKED